MTQLMTKTNFFIRLKRIFRLIIWLFMSAKQFRRLDNTTPEQREQVLRQSALNGLKILNITLQHTTLPEKPNNKGLLIVSNHISWVDIMAVCALYPCGFIAMKEILSWPIIGKIIKNAGTVFIDRSNRKEIDPINAAITEKLNQGANVCFFPEARTTLGNNILPLKAALFQAAINGEAAVQPLALRYYNQNQRTEQVSFAHINLIVSIWRIVSIPNITVKIDVGTPFIPDSNADRFTVKEQVETFLSSIILSDSPNPERILLNK